MSIVWLNGALLDADAARIDPADRGFTLGDGVFETIRAAAGVPLHAARHVARLREGAAVLGIAVPATDAVLFDAFCVLLRENALSEAAVRVTLTRGPAARGVLPMPGSATLLITAGILPDAAGSARLIVSERTRRNEHSPVSRIKSTNYLDSILARKEAAERGADDSIVLNTAGKVAEATAANIFLRLHGRWVTPPVTDGALPGISRGRLLEAGLAIELSLSRDEIASADAGCLTNSLSCRVIESIGARTLDAAHPALRRLEMFLAVY